jgi:hypothetical protein
MLPDSEEVSLLPLEFEAAWPSPDLLLSQPMAASIRTEQVKAAKTFRLISVDSVVTFRIK